MKIINILKPNNYGKILFENISLFLNDPFYYFLSIPYVFLAILAAGAVLMACASIMILVWILVKLIALGSVPPVSEQPFKMYIGMASMSIFTLCAGVIHRHLTKPEKRGQFISFSNILSFDNEIFKFEIIDKRATLLVGTSISVDVMMIDGICRRINLGSPGIIAIPTEIKFGINKVFNEQYICNECGAQHCEDNIEEYFDHLMFYHKKNGEEMRKNRKKNLEILLDKIDYINIRLSGVDEVSGKGCIAEKEFARESIVNVVVEGDQGDSPFSLITDDKVSTGDDDQGFFVHVDFKYN